MTVQPAPPPVFTAVQTWLEDIYYNVNGETLGTSSFTPLRSAGSNPVWVNPGLDAPYTGFRTIEVAYIATPAGGPVTVRVTRGTSLPYTNDGTPGIGVLTWDGSTLDTPGTVYGHFDATQPVSQTFTVNGPPGGGVVLAFEVADNELSQRGWNPQIAWKVEEVTMGTVCTDVTGQAVLRPANPAELTLIGGFLGAGATVVAPTGNIADWVAGSAATGWVENPGLNAPFPAEFVAGVAEICVANLPACAEGTAGALNFAAVMEELTGSGVGSLPNAIDSSFFAILDSADNVVFGAGAGAQQPYNTPVAVSGTANVSASNGDCFRLVAILNVAADGTDQYSVGVYNLTFEYCFDDQGGTCLPTVPPATPGCSESVTVCNPDALIVEACHQGARVLVEYQRDSTGRILPFNAAAPFHGRVVTLDGALLGRGDQPVGVGNVWPSTLDGVCAAATLCECDPRPAAPGY